MHKIRGSGQKYPCVLYQPNLSWWASVYYVDGVPQAHVRSLNSWFSSNQMSHFHWCPLDNVANVSKKTPNYWDPKQKATQFGCGRWNSTAHYASLAPDWLYAPQFSSSELSKKYARQWASTEAKQMLYESQINALTYFCGSLPALSRIIPLLYNVRRENETLKHPKFIKING